MADPRDDSQPTPETPATPAPPAAPAARPKPAFGEYAPEGWEWKPEEHNTSESAAPATAPATASPASRSDAGRVTGVPHNLGAGSQTTAAAPVPAPAAPAATPQNPGSAPAANGEPAPYRATVAPPAPQQYASQQAVGGPKPRTGDRIATIILLVIGALGALISAQSMLALNSSFSLMAEAVGMSDFTVPEWLGTLGTVSALAFIAVYAVTLIFSIQRMRARKITFWVPLTAGAIVFVAMFVLTTIAITSMPELMTQMSDPDAMQKLLDYTSTTQ